MAGRNLRSGVNGQGALRKSVKQTGVLIFFKVRNLYAENILEFYEVLSIYIYIYIYIYICVSNDMQQCAVYILYFTANLLYMCRVPFTPIIRSTGNCSRRPLG
jgi:hypothetical protein